MEMFLLGAQESSKKKGPGAMLEQLRADNPGVYTLPNFVEVQGEVGRLFEKQKKAGGKTSELLAARDNDDSDFEQDEDTAGLEKDLLEEITKCREIIDRYGGKIKPDWVKRKMNDELGRNNILTNAEDNCLKKAIKSARDRCLKHRIQSIIG